MVKKHHQFPLPLRNVNLSFTNSQNMIEKKVTYLEKTVPERS